MRSPTSKCATGRSARCAGISLTVASGELVALLGANGAGKSSTLMCIAGALKAASGSIRLDGEDITSAKPEAIVRRGIATVPETRDVFPDLTVDGEPDARRLYPAQRRTPASPRTAQRMLALFPRLAERARQPAGTLSGGEQQMLVIARAMMSRPKVLLLDEPSLGLAPVVVDQIFEMIAALKASGTDHPAGRAERRQGARRRRPRLCHAARPHRRVGHAPPRSAPRPTSTPSISEAER